MWTMIVIYVFYGHLRSAHLTDDTYTSNNGTPVYSSREWFKNKNYHGLPATVWSLGILLYTMACGDIPFRNQHQICTKDVTFRHNLELSSKFQDLVSKCLQRYPSHRIKLKEILNHRWL